MRWQTGLGVMLVVAALLLSGCLAKNQPAPVPATPTLFADFQRTGGLAGFNDRLVIFDNGAALVSARSASREFTLNRSELDGIAAVFEASQFATLEGNYTSSRGGADLLQYSITYRGKTVYTEDTAIPPALEPIIQEMDRILTARLSGQADLPLPTIAR